MQKGPTDETAASRKPTRRGSSDEAAVPVPRKAEAVLPLRTEAVHGHFVLACAGGRAIETVGTSERAGRCLPTSVETAEQASERLPTFVDAHGIA